MATSLPYQPYRAPTAAIPSGFTQTSDPRKLAQTQGLSVASQGQGLMAGDQDLANQYGAQASGTQSYLNPIESNLAEGGGGYNPAEQAQIELNPQQQQDIVTGAGISAGAGTASAVGAAERAAAATGGNPAAMATYRARAAQTQGAQAGDAMTEARIAAHGAGAAGAEQVGQARMGQQAQGLNYYGGLQGQQNSNSLAEQGLQQGAFGTTTQGTGQAAQLGLSASQTPSTSDKIIGGVAGAASAFLGDGTAGYGNDGMDAVLGENGPEAIVEAASDPVRSDTTFMADGGDIGDGLPMSSGAYGATSDGDMMGAVKGPSFGRTILNNYLQNSQAAATNPAATPAWNPTTPYQQLGSAIGKLAAGGLNQFGGTASPAGGGGMYADGGAMPDMGGISAPKAPSFNPKIITSPTHVHLSPGDKVVPLGYRPNAKIRPSAAVGGMANTHLAPRLRQTYGASRAA